MHFCTRKMRENNKLEQERVSRMAIASAFFYLFAFFAVAAGFMVIASRNPVHSVLFLILAFFNASGLFIIVGAEFLALLLIVVYVGAVAVLFLFVVMMLNLNLDPLREGFIKNLPLGIVVGVIVAAEMFLALGSGGFKLAAVSKLSAVDASNYSNTKALGRVLYTQYFYAFEIAAVILLLAMVSAITLTMRKIKGTKHQNPAEQVKVKRNDRLKIIKMEPEPKGDSND